MAQRSLQLLVLILLLCGPVQAQPVDETVYFKVTVEDKKGQIQTGLK